MKKWILIGSILSCMQLSAQEYSRVKVYANEEKLKELLRHGVGIDHGEYRKGYYFTSDFSEKEIKIMESLGIQYDILIPDVTTFYQQRNTATHKKETKADPLSFSYCETSAPAYKTPENFNYGSMGDFHTLDEIMVHLDSMTAKFPHLISWRQAINNTKSIEGREIYYVKISDNHSSDEDEPEILFTALHHSREPMSAMQLIYFMYYLLENYDQDNTIKYIIDNTELFFVPCLNPDGYVYNETEDPDGGGLWRKNRRVTSDSTHGVDMNRNYAREWGYDDFGSSNELDASNYRGTAPFSEPETRAIRDFCISRDFKIAMNNHSAGNLLLHPWGFDYDTLTPDSQLFNTWAAFYTEENEYTAGEGPQILYPANGVSDDWMYGEQQIFAYTPEIGDTQEDWFWPQKDRILPLCRSMLQNNLRACLTLLKLARTSDEEPYYVNQLNGAFNYEIQNIGLDSVATFTVDIRPLDNWISSVGATKTYSSLSFFESKKDSISYSLNPSIQSGQAFSYVIEVSNGIISFRDTIHKMYGSEVIAYSTNANSMSGWASFNGWGLSYSNYHSSNASITDSPNGNYLDSAETSVFTINPINLSTSASARLYYWASWDVERRYDYVQLQYQIDGETEWIPLCGDYTVKGGWRQDEGKPIYHDEQLEWVQEEVNLDHLVGNNVRFQFFLKSDKWGSDDDGFYFDDFKVTHIPDYVNEIKDFSQVQLDVHHLPNPATDYTYINYTLPEDGSFMVYNAFGQIIHQQELSRGVSSFRLNTSSYARGVYYYQLRSGRNHSSSKRLVVQ